MENKKPKGGKLPGLHVIAKFEGWRWRFPASSLDAHKIALFSLDFRAKPHGGWDGSRVPSREALESNGPPSKALGEAPELHGSTSFTQTRSKSESVSHLERLAASGFSLWHLRRNGSIVCRLRIKNKGQSAWFSLTAHFSVVGRPPEHKAADQWA